MRWKTWNKSGERRNKRMKWNKWFAWCPVVIYKETPGYAVCSNWVWLEWVERKDLFGTHQYDYRERQKI